MGLSQKTKRYLFILSLFGMEAGASPGLLAQAPQLQLRIVEQVKKASAENDLSGTAPLPTPAVSPTPAKSPTPATSPTPAPSPRTSGTPTPAAPIAKSVAEAAEAPQTAAVEAALDLEPTATDAASPLPKVAPTATRPATAASGGKKTARIEAAEPNLATSEDAPIAASPTDTAPLEVVEQRYPSGGIMLEREVTQDAEGNYINHGAWRLWDQAGNLIVEGRCRDNQLHGGWRRIYQGKESKLFAEAPYQEFQPPFISEATFEDGMLHGVWKITDAQDRKVSEIEFADGHRHGFARWWYPDGKKMQEIPFRSGFVDGELRYWGPDDELLHEESYKAGRKLTTKVEFHSPGVKKSEVSYLQPQLVLQAGDDWWNAKLAVFSVQGQMEKHGPATLWFANGQKRMDAEYRHGQMDGRCTWWYTNGQRAAEGVYAEGKPHDHWTWWHANGQKSASGQYQAGAAVGTWAWWFDDGRLKERVAANAGANEEKDASLREAIGSLPSLPEVHLR